MHIVFSESYIPTVVLFYVSSGFHQRQRKTRCYLFFFHINLRTTDSVIIPLYEYKYDVVLGKKRLSWYFTRAKIRIDTTLYKYDLKCLRREKYNKVVSPRIRSILFFFVFVLLVWNTTSYTIRLNTT